MSLLAWLLTHDSTPNVLPVFPENAELGLVVAHLLSGEVLAEVLPHPQNVVEACGDKVPLGRLFFQVPRAELFPVCDQLTPEVFGGLDESRGPFF